MEQLVLDDVLSRVRTALESNDFTNAASIIEELRPADQADLFQELNEIQQIALLPELNPADAADILEELYDEDVLEITDMLRFDDLIDIINEMEPDEAADLLDDLAAEQAEAILAQMSSPNLVQNLIAYPDDSAGGLMTSAFMALQRRWSAQQSIEAVRAWHPDEETIFYLFVTDRLKRLVGVVNIRQLIVAAPETPIMEIMATDVIAVEADKDQEQCAELMRRYDLLALPVVSEQGILLGIITIDDLVDVIRDEASEDIQRLGGSEPLDRAYLDTSIFNMTRKRIGWLLILFFTATLTGWVMDAYQNEIEALVTLTIFIPLLIGTGGNAGSQTTATIIRAVAIGDIEWQDGLRVWFHEARIGLTMGIGMSLISLILAMVWVGNIWLAVTVCISILSIVIWATSAGSLLPLIAVRFGIDPTVVSGPVMSTLVDATGLFIYFNIAKLILGI